MNEHIFKEQASVLAKDAGELILKILEKQHKGILEEMHDQIKKRDAEIKRLKKTLQTAIAWQMREFGDHGVKELLGMLEESEDPSNQL